MKCVKKCSQEVCSANDDSESKRTKNCIGIKPVQSYKDIGRNITLSYRETNMMAM